MLNVLITARSTYQTGAQSKISVKILVQPSYPLVSRICHTGTVANVDFKLGRSLLDGNKLRRKAESSREQLQITPVKSRGGGGMASRLRVKFLWG